MSSKNTFEPISLDRTCRDLIEKKVNLFIEERLQCLKNRADNTKLSFNVAGEFLHIFGVDFQGVEIDHLVNLGSLRSLNLKMSDWGGDGSELRAVTFYPIWENGKIIDVTSDSKQCNSDHIQEIVYQVAIRDILVPGPKLKGLSFNGLDGLDYGICIPEEKQAEVRDALLTALGFKYKKDLG